MENSNRASRQLQNDKSNAITTCHFERMELIIIRNSTSSKVDKMRKFQAGKNHWDIRKDSYQHGGKQLHLNAFIISRGAIAFLNDMR